jgi:hypothetical protein
MNMENMRKKGRNNYSDVEPIQVVSQIAQSNV